MLQTKEQDENLATTFREEREIKEIQVRKEEVKLSLFANDMILYIENPKDATRKLCKLINEFGKVVNTQKSLASLCTDNKKSEDKIKEKSHLPLHQEE